MLVQDRYTLSFPSVVVVWYISRLVVADLFALDQVGDLVFDFLVRQS